MKTSLLKIVIPLGMFLVSINVDVKGLVNEIPIEQEAYTAEEKELLSKVAFSEAGNQGIQGMRYVIATVLNRVDHPNFPNTIKEVIFQPNQFYITDMTSESSYQAVEEEIVSRSDDRILYFCSGGGYPRYGTPLFEYKDHKFSGNEE